MSRTKALCHSPVLTSPDAPAVRVGIACDPRIQFSEDRARSRFFQTIVRAQCRAIPRRP